VQRNRSGPVRQADVRGANLALALQQIAEQGAVSRADIAAATGMTRATASSLVDALLAAGLVVETGPTSRSGVGRPAMALTLSAEGPAALGLEVNVDYLAACVVDFAGTVRLRTEVAHDTRNRSPQQTLRRLDGVAARAVRQSAAAVRVATLAVPGLVGDDGALALAPNLGWRDLDLVPVLRGLPALATLDVGVENEANLAALAEQVVTGSHDFLFVSGEIGVGAGIVLDGRLFPGRHGWSGEIGHLAVQPDGPRCRCGATGCLEQYAGQEALLRAAGLPADAPAALLAERAARGEPRVLDALERGGRALGTAVAGALNLLDLDRVVLAGVYRELAPWLAPVVQDELRTRVLAADWTQPRVLAATVGREGAVLGAGQLGVSRLRAEPGALLAAVPDERAAEVLPGSGGAYA